MSKYVELHSMHVFEMPVISSPGTVSIMTCMWALE